jgi:hypothetical protein
LGEINKTHTTTKKERNMKHDMRFSTVSTCILIITGLLGLASVTHAAGPEMTDNIDKFFSKNGVTVTKALYPRAETARQILETQADVGVNKFSHIAVLAPTDDQPVVRMNRDAYYSKAVVNVSKGATITLPSVPEGTYMTMQPVTEDHRPQPMSYGPGTYELATHTGDHVIVLIRLDANFSSEQVQQYQKQITINAGSDKPFYTQPMEKTSFYRVENQLKADLMKIIKEEGPLKLSATLFSSPTDESRGYYDPMKNQIAAAIGWGGALAKDNIYETSPNFPTKGCYQLNFEDPKNKHFWSITVYNKAGFMFNDIANANSYQAKPNKDGTYTISMGCGPEYPNFIPIENDTGVFSFTARHYGPSDRVLKDGYRLVPLLKKVK